MLSSKSLQSPKDETLSHQETEDLISTLPKERGWASPYIYKYQGTWHLDQNIRGVISCQKHFKAQDSDIFIATYPKSGTTWLKALLFSLVNRNRYSPMSENHPLLTQNPHDLIQVLEMHHYANNQIPDFSSLTSPRIFATHLPFASLPDQSAMNKIVYLCRNPKDTLVSYWYFVNKLNKLPQFSGGDPVTFNDVFDKFCVGITAPGGSWWDHVLGYWNQSKENPDRVFFLKYEDMKENSSLLVRRLAEFLGFPFSAEEEEFGMVEQIFNLCSFENLSTQNVNKNGKTLDGVENTAFFRRGVVGDWKNHLDSQMIEKIDRITEHKFSGSGLMIM